MTMPRLCIAAAAFVTFAAASAMAQETVQASATLATASGKDFLAALAGNWRGSGDAQATPRTAPTRISCRLSAVYDPARAVLTNSGRCGTTKGSQDVNGTLSAAGDTLKGAFVSGFDSDKLQNQRMQLRPDALVVEAEMANDGGGKVHKLRTVLTKPKNGAFVVQNQFYDWDKAVWIIGGEIAFRKQ